MTSIRLHRDELHPVRRPLLPTRPIPGPGTSGGPWMQLSGASIGRDGDGMATAPGPAILLRNLMLEWFVSWLSGLSGVG